MAKKFHQRDLQKEAQAASFLKEQLKLITDDEDAIRDTIEGETDLHEAIKAVLSDMREDEISISGIAEIMKNLTARKTRLEIRYNAQKRAIERAMIIGGIPSLPLPEATLSIGMSRASVIITDEKAIDAKYKVAVNPKIDKAAIKKDLDAGIPVAGAEMSVPEKHLSIRKK